MPATLSPKQLERYQTEGYLVIPKLLTAQEVDAFLAHESTPKPAEWQKGLLSHTADPQWKYLAHHPRIAGIAEQLLRGRPMIVQTMYLNKPPSGGKGIALHQDTRYIRNEPNTLMACWLAMDDTDESNGGLCVVPGSHRRGLRDTHLPKREDEHTVWEKPYAMRDPNGVEWSEEFYSFEVANLTPDEIAKLTVPRGGGVFFTGMTIHGSFANRSEARTRRAFAVHYIKDGTWIYRQDIQEVIPAV
jgi:phytanoyl-CoA hydroxylase